MEIILKYINYYISLYNDNLKLEDKILLIKSINALYRVSNNINEEINSIYSNFIKDKDDVIYLVDEYNDNINKNNFMSKDDLVYLYELIKKIKINNNIVSKDMNDTYYLNYYMNNNEDYLMLINYLYNKTIYDDNFNTSCIIDLYNDNLIILNNRSIIDYIHEITHIYTRNLNNFYIETPSIMMELGIQSFYKLGDKNNRINNIKNIYSCSINNILRYANAYIFQNEISYYLGTIIALGFIYRNGNYFENIKLGVDTLCSNNNLCIKDMLNILNIKENDIINAFNNKEKILCKR